MRVALVAGAVLLGVAGTLVPPILALPPLTWLALAAAGWTAGLLLALRACVPVPPGCTHRAWGRTPVGGWAMSWTAGAAVTLAFDSPAAAVILLVAAPAGLHVAVTAADTVALARPLDVARPGDVQLMMRFDPRLEESEAVMAGLAAGMVVAAAWWTGAVVAADLRLVAPWSALLLGGLVGASVTSLRAMRCLPAALRLQYAVTAGDHARRVRLFRAVRRSEESSLPPELAGLLPVWAARGLTVSTIVRIAGPAGLLAVMGAGGLLVLVVLPTLLTAVVLLAVLLVMLATAPVARRRWEDRLERAASVTTDPVT